jgi:serine protease Do
MAEVISGQVIDAVSAVQKLGPAVVTVVSSRNGRGGGVGSGVIIDDQGHILTNAHVVSRQERLDVIFASGSRRLSAKLIGTDRYSDVAVIKVDAPVPAVADLGDSNKLLPGQPVIAIGSTLGSYRNTVTAGVVSAVNRRFEGINAPLVQTDAAINQGNSGGPLANLYGEVIGINTLVVRGGGWGGGIEGVGFAVPINIANALARQMIKQGFVAYPYLGIQYQELTPELAAYYDLKTQSGALIQELVADSPAAKAGVENGDIVVSLGEEAIHEDNPLSIALTRYGVGDTVELKVVRGVEKLTIAVKLGARPDRRD